MIKLIITDMDGTLLDEKKRLPEEFPQILQRLKERGVQFAVGSGRSYPILRQDFADYLKDIYFICDNGSILIKEDQIQYSRTFSRELTMEVIKICDSIEEIIPVLCGNGFSLFAGKGAVRQPLKYSEIFAHPHLSGDDPHWTGRFSQSVIQNGISSENQ